MNNTEEKLIQFPAADADRLLACADGLCALLYLHIQRNGGFSLNAAARDLKCSEADIAAAAGRLRQMGLILSPEPPLPSEDLPEYSGGDIARRMKSDSGFEAVVLETQQALGRLLSANDLRILFGIYDYFGLPADVIFVLVHHCVETYQARAGAGRMPTLRRIEDEARFWAKNEIVTLDAADAHIKRESERSGELGRAKEALQIFGRELTGTEAKYINAWLDMGFGPDALAVAYDRTVIGTGRLTWKYMDKILQDWSSRGLFTPEQIEQLDSRRSRNPAKNPGQDGQDGDMSRDIEEMRRRYERIRKGL